MTGKLPLPSTLHYDGQAFTPYSYILFPNSICLWRSNKIADVAEETFKEFNFPNMGIVMSSSQAFTIMGRIPFPSLPITKTNFRL
jgi:hypothetical protein